jgi:uncharacterized membrane protein YkoI
MRNLLHNGAPMLKSAQFAILFSAAALLPAAHADEHRSSSSAHSASSGNSSTNDQDDARAALRQGKAMPLTAILEIVARRQPGTVIEVHLRTKKRLIYQIEVLSDDGHRRQLKLDARSGEVLSVEDD